MQKSWAGVNISNYGVNISNYFTSTTVDVKFDAVKYEFRIFIPVLYKSTLVEAKTDKPRERKCKRI